MYRWNSLFLLLINLCYAFSESNINGVLEITDLAIVAKTYARFSKVTVTAEVTNTQSMGREFMFAVQVPISGFITGFQMTTGNTTLRGIVQEKSAADKAYDQAKDSGASAGKVSQTPSNPGRDMDNFAVYMNVAGNSSAKFELNYQEAIKRRLGFYRQIFHVEPKQVVRNLSLTCIIEEPQDIHGLSYSLPNQTEALESSSQAVTVKAAPKQRVVEYRPTVEQQQRYNAGTGIVGDFVVAYDVDHQNDGGIVLVQNDYFVHYFSPSGLQILPKNIIFVIDISGSMSGFKIQKVREVMHVILGKLRDYDYFNILLFDDRITMWKKSPERATASNIEVARRYANETLVARGSTNINSALIDAVDLLRGLSEREDGRGRVVVFLTDGHPTTGVRDPTQIRRNVKTRNEGLASIFALGFGSDVDMAFLEALAYENGGFARRIYEESDASDQLETFYAEISTPLLVDVQIDYTPTVIVSGEVTQTAFPQYFQGTELVVAGRLRNNAPSDWQATVTAEGYTGSTSGRLDFTATPEYLQDGPRVTSDFAERYWAFSRIKELLKMELVEENLEQKAIYREMALNMSLAYQFVTPLTSMVVTESVNAGEVDKPTMDREMLSGKHSGSGIMQSRYPIAAQDSYWSSAGHSIVHDTTLLGLVFVLISSGLLVF